MNKLIKIAEITPEYTLVWECASYVLDGYSHFKESRGKASVESYLSFISKYNPDVHIRLISKTKVENSPKKTGLNADIIYSDDVINYEQA